MNPDQVFLGMVVNPGLWQLEPIIRVNHPEILKIMGSNDKYYSFAAFFKDERYILQPLVEDAYNKKVSLRSKFDNEVIRLDERINICYYVFSGEFLRLFVVSGDISQPWYNHQDIRGKINNEDSVFVENILYLYIQEVRKSQSSGDWKIPADILSSISGYQQRYAADILPSSRRVSLEIFMNKSDVFARISNYYGLVGFVLLLLQFAVLFFKKLKLNIPVNLSIVLIIILFSLHTVGLGIRWYVAGHAPWSNGYEALTYIAWATVLAGLIFANRSAVTLSVTAILAFLVLHTAHLSWMDPQITNLVPVLKSYWLVIHVATITASYGFLGMGALLAYVNLLLMVFLTQHNRESVHLTILKQTNIIGMSLIIGLYLLAVGSFLGGVWANESWGRYWGWDPKETWAMVTILVYAFITHMRLVPGLKGIYAFNLSALLGFGTALMTYFGVNYYLTGLHSYAKGDPLPVPPVVYYTLAVVLVTAVAAYINDRRISLPKAVK
jgi:cytochrome c-type biogenesis protein CcsB